MGRLKSVVCDRVGLVAMGAGGVAQGRYVSRRHSGRNLLSVLGPLAMLIVVSFLAWLLADEWLALHGRNPSRDTGRGFVNTTSSTGTAEPQTVSVHSD
jgi:hypothetical protein